MEGRVTGKEGAINLTAEQSPYKLHPLVQVADDLFQYYVRGINPIDDFRGRPVIPQTAFEAGGMEANKAMLKHAWRNLGGSVLFNPAGQTVSTDESAIEKALKTFPLTVLGTFLKISDQGISERLEDVRKGVTEQSAEQRLKVQQGIRASLRVAPTKEQGAKLYADLRAKKALPMATTARGFVSRYMREAGKASGNPYVEAFFRASTVPERAALLDNYTSTLGAAEYKRVLEEIRQSAPGSLLSVEIFRSRGKKQAIAR